MSTSAAYVVRRAGAADAPVIGPHRAAMFRDMGLLAQVDLAPLAAASRAALAPALASGDYRGWLVECDGVVAAGAGVMLRPLLPQPGDPSGSSEAYVLNVYTEPAHRQRGLARRLMVDILAWCRARGVRRISLHASDDGRPLYLTLGFAPTNELRREV